MAEMIEYIGKLMVAERLQAMGLAPMSNAVYNTGLSNDILPSGPHRQHDK